MGLVADPGRVLAASIQAPARLRDEIVIDRGCRPVTVGGSSSRSGLRGHLDRGSHARRGGCTPTCVSRRYGRRPDLAKALTSGSASRPIRTIARPMATVGIAASRANVGTRSGRASKYAGATTRT